MKTIILIGLFALAITLGVSCKKEQINEPVKVELTKKVALEDTGNNPPLPNDGGIGGYPGGASVYPHSTGACYCGQYSVCHPTTIQHKPGCTGVIYHAGGQVSSCYCGLK